MDVEGHLCIGRACVVFHVVFADSGTGVGGQVVIFCGGSCRATGNNWNYIYDKRLDGVAPSVVDPHR